MRQPGRARQGAGRRGPAAAGFAGARAAGAGDRPLRNISEMRHFFRTNDTPIYFIGATPFNLLGLDRWIRNFSYVSYYDGWDGAHPRVFTPRGKPYIEFSSGEEINNWLLENAEVRAFIDRRRAGGLRPKIAMVFFDEETERICEELGYDLILPSAQLRNHLDSKLVTTRLANEVGVASVPNVLTSVHDWPELAEAADRAGLGSDLVVQTPYGDSGKTTFFISSEADWRRHRQDILGQDVKVMKRINHRPVAVEAVLTRRGTVIGPFMSELTGHARLTPYRGGWCGNEMYPEVITGPLRAKAATMIRRLGDRLGGAGYRGFFEVDVLVDTDADEVYLGELNPRISGASAITNVTAGATRTCRCSPSTCSSSWTSTSTSTSARSMTGGSSLPGPTYGARWSSRKQARSSSASKPRRSPGSTPSTVTARWSSAGRRWTGISCRTSPRHSSCASAEQATTAGRELTSVSW